MGNSKGGAISVTPGHVQGYLLASKRNQPLAHIGLAGQHSHQIRILDAYFAPVERRAACAQARKRKHEQERQQLEHAAIIQAKPLRQKVYVSLAHICVVIASMKGFQAVASDRRR